jgi:ribosome-associated translation inhibitor RaiA
MNHVRPNRHRFSSVAADRVFSGLFPCLAEDFICVTSFESPGSRAASWTEAFQFERPGFVLHRADAAEVPHCACSQDRSLASPMHLRGVNIGESTDMQITVHATGFDLTPHTRSFVESRLVSALGPFTVRIASVAVRLEASRRRTQPDTAACAIVVSLHPSGVVRSRAEDSRMHTAIDRAAAGIGIEVEREVLRTRRAAASPPVVGDRQHDRALELVLDEGRLSQHQREVLERTENDLRPVRVRERWKPPGAEDEDVPAVRRSVPHWRLKSERRGWSRPLSRIR